jgi:hypothetical protein
MNLGAEFSALFYLKIKKINVRLICKGNYLIFEEKQKKIVGWFSWTSGKNFSRTF